MATNTNANIGFEKQIWDAACVLRGNMDASEYKSVVLGLIFLKYISDRFEAKYNALVEEGDGFEEDKDEYTAENIFFVPENARWKVIAAAAHTPEIGAVIDEAMRSIEKENKRLKDILPKNFARPELDKRRLGEVVDLFTNIQMVEHGDSKDILGRTYEYCLSKFAEQEGKLAGEFYTPACVVRTLVEILQPYDGRVYDPCCGTGTLLIEAAFKATSRAPGLTRSFACESYPFMDRAGMDALRREAREAFRPDAPLSIAGSDIDPEALTLCGRHIRQAGLEGRVRVHRQDLKTLTLKGPAGVFLLNPPYGERLSDREGARALYRELGLLIRRHPGWRLCALSADPGFERAFGRRADKKRRLYNGRLECDFFLYLSGGQD